MSYFKSISSFRSQWKSDRQPNARKLSYRPTIAPPKDHVDISISCTLRARRVSARGPARRTRSATPCVRKSSGVSNVLSPIRLDRRAIPLQSCKRVFGNRPNDDGEGGAVIV